MLMKSRQFALVAGSSYLVIFFAAIFANFFVLESMLQDPLAAVQQNQFTVRLGIMAFMITVVFDVLVAWALFELFKDHPLTIPSTLFRMTHAIIMGVAIFSLQAALSMTTPESILSQVHQFNTIWLIGLFFFGVHLILLGNIIAKPKWIAIFLTIAGSMYMVDTTAHFVLANYPEYASVFLAMVALPSVVGEMSFAIWLLTKGGKEIPAPKLVNTK